MHTILLVHLLLLASTPLDLMIQTERDFSRASQDKGMRDAFISFISEDGILFRPGPVQGKKWLEANPPVTGVLSWQPVYADISGAGDLGFTTGPFVYRSEKGAQNGTYLTVWKLQPDGTFKFVIDFGISHAPPENAPEEKLPPKIHPLDQTFNPAKAEQLRRLLVDLDRKFSENSKSNGMVTAFEAWSTPDIRLLREGRIPVIGKAAGLQLLGEKNGSLTWVPAKAEIANSFDLGFTYGGASFNPSEGKAAKDCYYLRIWRRMSDGQWKVAVDIMNY